MRRHHALVEDDAALGVDAGGDIGGGHLAGRVRAVRPGPAAGSARADRRCRRCTRNRAAARPSCGSRRDNCRDAGCRSAGCRKRCGSSNAGYRRRPGAGQAGCRRSRPRSSRQSATAERRAPAARNMASPARRAPASAARRSGSRPGKRGAQRPFAARTAPPPCRAPRSRCAAGCARARASKWKWPRRTSRAQQRQRVEPAGAGESPSPPRHGPGSASGRASGRRLIATDTIATLTGVFVSCRAKNAGASTLTSTKAGSPTA